MIDKTKIHEQYIKTVKEIRSGSNAGAYNLGYAAALEFVLEYKGDEWKTDIMREKVTAAINRVVGE